jgi:peptide/nickel transport system permease protein
VKTYVAVRLLGFAPVLLGVSVLVFLLLHIVPGDPAQVLAGPLATPQDIARLRHDLGLTQPLHTQFLLWLGRVARGDLGRSISSGTPVLPYLLDKFKATAVLAAASLCLASVVGIVTGVASATRRGGWIDRLAMLIALVGVSMPVFWLGIVLILLFSLRFGWLPATGMFSPGLERLDPTDVARHLILPAVTLAAASTAVITRMTRSSVLEVIGQDFIRTARAKGASERRVMLGHALRNAITTVVTIVALSFGGLFSGALVTETLFAYPGMGKLIYDAVLGNDYNLALAALLLATIMTLVSNLAADIAYAAIDPRITYR